jgi:hypothetical protein
MGFGSFEWQVTVPRALATYFTLKLTGIPTHLPFSAFGNGEKEGHAKTHVSESKKDHKNKCIS